MKDTKGLSMLNKNFRKTQTIIEKFCNTRDKEKHHTTFQKEQKIRRETNYL